MQSFAIIPAAGLSRRMGRSKLLLPWGTETVIERVIATWRASRVDRVLLVVRADDCDLRAVCERYDVELVIPQHNPPEMKDSVAEGLRRAANAFAPTPDDVWLLAPADMPRFHASTVDRLLDEHDPEEPAILVPQHAGRRGHPVLFPWGLAAEVERLSPDEGIRVLRERHPTRLVPVGDADVLVDLDTPDDYKRWRPGDDGG